jgi:hypothetical protein
MVRGGLREDVNERIGSVGEDCLSIEFVGVIICIFPLCIPVQGPLF